MTLGVISVPSANDVALSSTYRDIVSYDDEFKTGNFLWVQGSILLFGQPEVEDITGIVPKDSSALFK